MTLKHLPATATLHGPHETGDGFLRPDAERIREPSRGALADPDGLCRPRARTDPGSRGSSTGRSWRHTSPRVPLSVRAAGRHAGEASPLHLFQAHVALEPVYVQLHRHLWDSRDAMQHVVDALQAPRPLSARASEEV